MPKERKDSEKGQECFSSERRELLKAGVAMAVAPMVAGLSAATPARAEVASAKKTKNVLIISASPRDKGNSDMLCDEFMRGAEAAGHHVDKIRLVEKHINFCTGCCSCIWDPGACVQEDDMAPILKKALEADVLVLASPVYFLTFNAMMKNFIDRFCPVYTMIDDLDIYLIASAAGGQRSVDSVVQGFRVFTGCLHGVRERGILAATCVWDEDGIEGARVLKDAYAMGLKA